MVGLRCTPVTFLFSGFTWLLLAALLGVATLLGLVYGTPLPKWLRTAHAHGALVGGVLQLFVGGLLAAIAHRSDEKHAFHRSHRALFLLFNGATLALLAGLGYGLLPLAGAAGLLLGFALVSVAKRAGRHDWNAWLGDRQPGWIYQASLGALFIGLLIGIGLAFQLFPEYQAHARLLHLHLVLLGSVTVLSVAFTQTLFSTVVNQEPAFPMVTRHTAPLLLFGFAALIAGFVTSSLYVELAAGGLLVAAAVASAVNLMKTWAAAGRPATAASDHLVLAGAFLALTTVLGTLMAVNYLSDPPYFPMGSLHVIAYTHVALIGFLAHSLCGALSYGLPVCLAAGRVPNLKKRGPYRQRLDAVMNRWRILQQTGISFGTVGLGVLAAWTWHAPLGSFPVQATCWVSVGLLILGLGVFAAKLAWVAGVEPAE